jgi:hypothetical protein
MVTEGGIVNADELLERLITRPLFGAATSLVTVQVSVPTPVIDVLAQLRVASEAEAGLAPLPWSLTVLERGVEVLLVALTFNCPVESVASFGLK